MPFVSIHNLFLDFIHSSRFTEISYTTETIYVYIHVYLYLVAVSTIDNNFIPLVLEPPPFFSLLFFLLFFSDPSFTYLINIIYTKHETTPVRIRFTNKLGIRILTSVYYFLKGVNIYIYFLYIIFY